MNQSVVAPVFALLLTVPLGNSPASQDTVLTLEWAQWFEQSLDRNEIYIQALSVGAVACLMAVMIYWPMRGDLSALRPEWARRGFLGWAVGPWFDLATVYSRQVYRTRATRFTVWSVRLLLPISGIAFLIAQTLFDRF